ncbi:MAG: hypothetical protein DHS20C11_30150 [Lysobacteraceae bacterium]|nr:MAG: hypothetical protein DHS20C11_30150 [Xanthomonadaceae bacterium]
MKNNSRCLLVGFILCLVVSIAQGQSSIEISGVFDVVDKETGALQAVYSVSNVGDHVYIDTRTEEEVTKTKYQVLLIESDQSVKKYDVCSGEVGPSDNHLVCDFKDGMTMQIGPVGGDFCNRKRGTDTVDNPHIWTSNICNGQGYARCTCYVVAERDETPGTGTGGSGGD